MLSGQGRGPGAALTGGPTGYTVLESVLDVGVSFEVQSRCHKKTLFMTERSE
ncbi:hypothetical protein [Deinococcus sp.]|uniref:hypothetical protein n=1 Tax=Deinococcus sp. TaxID=47478 RepID=UPI0025CBFA6C|nr:hypothetical protein [Deinococcus sp.]